MGIHKTSPTPSSPKKKKTTPLQVLFKLDSDTDAILQTSPSSPSNGFISMISNCAQLFTFTNPSESPTQQDLKRQNLLLILSTLRTAKSSLGGCVLSPLISMLSANLFRTLPLKFYTCPSSDSFDDDAPTVILAPSWPHLQIVYDILALLVTNIDPKSLSLHFDRRFLLNLLTLFQSEDPRERDRLKNIYHQLYTKMTSERSFMRRSMSNALLHFVVEAERHCGIGDLLEIWGSIINGFAVPLKEEHKVLLMRVLIPLHKMKGMCTYHQQLSYCVSQFVEKDPGLTVGVVKGILRYWPVTNCPKEVLLIGEVEDLVEVMKGEEFEKVAVILCSQIAKCLASCCSQVAERALYSWSNERFVRMLSRCMEQVLPSVVQAIEKNIRWHWNKSVQDLTLSVKKMLEEMEPGLYLKCLRDLDVRGSLAEKENQRRKEMWDKLERAVSTRNFVQPETDDCTSVSN